MNISPEMVSNQITRIFLRLHPWTTADVITMLSGSIMSCKSVNLSATAAKLNQRYLSDIKRELNSYYENLNLNSTLIELEFTNDGEPESCEVYFEGSLCRDSAVSDDILETATMCVAEAFGFIDLEAEVIVPGQMEPDLNTSIGGYLLPDENMGAFLHTHNGDKLFFACETYTHD